MVIKNFHILALLLAFVLPLGACKDKAVALPLDENKLVIQTTSGQSHVFDVEVVSTPKELMQGLMHRTEMAEDAGMLFDFGGVEQERRFWMKNTLIFLDIIFIRADGTIHHIHEKAVPHDLTGIPSYGPVAAVLEINGGLSSKLGIEKGNKISHNAFSE